MRFGSFARAIACCLVVFLWPAESVSAGQPRSDKVARVEGGEFSPLYGVQSGQKLVVDSFAMDRFAATNQEFFEFVEEHKRWSPEQVPSLLADELYLSHWSDKSKQPRASQLDKPVTFVSWFAAQAYCESKGGRLPTVLEWEYAAAASETKRNATRDPAFVQKLLEWYSAPAKAASAIPRVGQSPANFWGIHDLHGVIWEWTFDFNSVFVSGDNRQDSESVKDLVCGAGAVSASNREDYAAFMRYAMRNSLRASYTTSSLGFRCVYEE